MKDLIETIVRELVDHPEDINVTEHRMDGTVKYQLTVNKEDMGKVIGKQGRIAKAIRMIVYAAGANRSERIQLEIV